MALSFQALVEPSPQVSLGSTKSGAMCIIMLVSRSSA
jgi:hypothetical protein